jgi:glutaredoxin
LTNPAVLVWTLPSCVQCLSTKRQLEKHGIPYIERDLTMHPDKVEEFKKQGLVQAPIVEAAIGAQRITFSGFRPDLIKQIAKEN